LAKGPRATVASGVPSARGTCFGSDVCTGASVTLIFYSPGLDEIGGCNNGKSGLQYL
jgi:hypothetical protein